MVSPVCTKQLFYYYVSVKDIRIIKYSLSLRNNHFYGGIDMNQTKILGFLCLHF